MNQEDLHREIIRDVETGLNIYTSIRYPKIKCLVMGIFGIGGGAFYCITQPQQILADPVGTLIAIGMILFFMLLGWFM